MKHEQPPPELISAYLDGETTPAERAAVELWIANSAIFRQELDELRQISDLVRDLPKQSLPPEFSAAVLQIAERRTLLPENGDVPKPTRDPAPRRWHAGYSLAVAAALLFIGVQLTWFFAQREPVQVERAARRAAPDIAMNDRRPAAPVEQHTANSRAEPLNEAPAATPMSSSATAPVTELLTDTRRKQPGEVPIDAANAGSPQVKRSSAATAAAGDPVADAPQKSVGPAAPQVAAGAAARPKNNMLAMRRMTVVGKNAAGLNIGQVVSTIDASGDRVAVVKVYVVDRAAGLDQLQVVLLQNQVVDQTPPHRAEAQGPARVEVLFVKAAPEQIAAALESMKQKDLLVDIKVQPSLELATLDRDVRRGLESPEPTSLNAMQADGAAKVADATVAADKQTPGAPLKMQIQSRAAAPALKGAAPMPPPAPEKASTVQNESAKSGEPTNAGPARKDASVEQKSPPGFAGAALPLRRFAALPNPPQEARQNRMFLPSQVLNLAPGSPALSNQAQAPSRGAAAVSVGVPAAGKLPLGAATFAQKAGAKADPSPGPIPLPADDLAPPAVAAAQVAVPRAAGGQQRDLARKAEPIRVIFVIEQ